MKKNWIDRSKPKLYNKFKCFQISYHIISFFRYVEHKVLLFNEKHYSLTTDWRNLWAPRHLFYTSHRTLMITYYAHVHTTHTPTSVAYIIKKNWCCSNDFRWPKPHNAVTLAYKMSYFSTINTHPYLRRCLTNTIPYVTRHCHAQTISYIQLFKN